MYTSIHLGLRIGAKSRDNKPMKLPESWIRAPCFTTNLRQRFEYCASLANNMKMSSLHSPERSLSSRVYKHRMRVTHCVRRNESPLFCCFARKLCMQVVGENERTSRMSATLFILRSISPLTYTVVCTVYVHVCTAVFTQSHC